MHDADKNIICNLGITDFLIYFIKPLVTDKVLPHGYLADFVKLEQSVRRSSDRTLRIAASISEAEARLSLEADKKRLYDTNDIAATAVDQLLVAADLKPRRFRSKWQRAYYEGPTARKDAESAERLRWILHLQISCETLLPRWVAFSGEPSQLSTLARGQTCRYVTLTGQGRSKVSELACAGSQFGIPGSLEACHRVHASSIVRTVCTWISEIDLSYIFMQDVAGVEDRLTDAALCDVTKREVASICVTWETASPSSSFSCDHSCSARGQRRFPGYADIFESLVLVDVASILGNSALRRPSWDGAVGLEGVGDWSCG